MAQIDIERIDADLVGRNCGCWIIIGGQRIVDMRSHDIAPGVEVKVVADLQSARPVRVDLNRSVGFQIGIVIDLDRAIPAENIDTAACECEIIPDEWPAKGGDIECAKAKTCASCIVDQFHSAGKIAVDRYPQIIKANRARDVGTVMS